MLFPFSFPLFLYNPSIYIYTYPYNPCSFRQPPLRITSPPTIMQPPSRLAITTDRVHNGVIIVLVLNAGRRAWELVYNGIYCLYILWGGRVMMRGGGLFDSSVTITSSKGTQGNQLTIPVYPHETARWTG